MTDMPDLPERTDDNTAEGAGHDLTREMSHPPPGMTRPRRAGKTSRPAGLADPRQELDLFQPYCSGTMLVLGRDPTPGWPRLERCTAGLQDHRYEVNSAYRERSAWSCCHVRLGQQCALETRGWSFRSVCPSRSSSPSCADDLAAACAAIRDQIVAGRPIGPGQSWCGW